MDNIELVAQPITEYERERGLISHYRRADLPPEPPARRCVQCDALLRPLTIACRTRKYKDRKLCAICYKEERKLSRLARKSIALLSMVLLSVIITFAQGSNLGSSSSPVVNRQGIPLPGALITVCQPLTTSSVTVSSGVAAMVMTSPVQAAGFFVGGQIMVQGFTGSDTYLNAGTLTNGVITGGWTVLSAVGSTLTFAVNHANATASSAGTALGIGSTFQGCAGLAPVYQDPALTIPVSQPFAADQLGNWNVFVPQGLYYVQMYGRTIQATLRLIQAPCVLNGVGCSGGSSSGGPFVGPSPWIDITAAPYKARSTSVQGLASCNGTSQITTASNYALVNGDGVTIYGCGATQVMSAPAAPTVQPIQSAGFTVPDSLGPNDAAGGSTYEYLFVPLDGHGGIGLPGTPTTITTGQATLGQNTSTVSSASVTPAGSLTVVTSSASGLQAGAAYRFKNSTNAVLSGMYNVSSVTNPTTTVTSGTFIKGQTTSSTGGSLVFFRGNRLTVTPANNVWQYAVCAKRPGDSSLHVIGLTYPSLAHNQNAFFIYTDWGPTMTTAPVLPPYVTDAICTAGLATNDYLTTTIVSGAGSTVLTVADPASQTASSQTIWLDPAVAITKAAAAAVAAGSGAFIYIPPGQFFTTHSAISLGPIGVLQQGGLVIGETITLNGTIWNGGFAVGSEDQFAFGRYPAINPSGAWPGVFIIGSDTVMDSIAMHSSGNQALNVLIDGGNAAQITLSNMSGTTGGTSADYTGINFVVMAGGAYQFRFDTISTITGPGQYGPGYGDTTWTPSIYGANGNVNNAAAPTQILLRHVNMSARGFYEADSNNFVAINIEGLYMQGGIEPTFGFLTSGGNETLALQVTGSMWQDTSPEAHIAILDYVGNTLPAITADGPLDFLSVESGGLPQGLTGQAPSQQYLHLSPTASSMLLNGVSNGTYNTLEQATIALATGAPSVTGCSVSNVLGGGWAGSFTSGTTGTCTVTITPPMPGITAPNGFVCTAKDLTTPADEPKQTAYNTTTCTLSWTTVSGDLVTWQAIAF